MKTLAASAGSVALALVVLSAAAGAPAAKPFAPHQEARGIGNLVAPGDRVVLAYDAPGFKRTAGTVYVRNDLQRRFGAMKLRHASGPSSALEARVPARVVHGHKLLYYAVIRDVKSGRSARVPAKGTSSALVLGHAMRIRLGTHRFGAAPPAGAVVARARADQVGWQIPPEGCGCGPSFGPETFLVGRDGSVWLDDDLNNRLLGWDAGRPDAIVRTVPLPPNSADHDVALGPNGSFYVTGTEGRGANLRFVLHRLSRTGRTLWKARLAGTAAETSGEFEIGWNSPLYTGPDRTLYVLVGMFGRPGGEAGSMPVATSTGHALAPAAQRRGTLWPGQPVTGGQLVSEAYTARTDGPVTEMRYALLDRRGKVVRAWRVSSRTQFGPHGTSELVGGDPIIVLDTYLPSAGKSEYVVLRLGHHGVRRQFSLPRAIFGDNLLADLRIGPDGNLYQLATSPQAGVTISRFSLR